MPCWLKLLLLEARLWRLEDADWAAKVQLGVGETPPVANLAQYLGVLGMRFCCSWLGVGVCGKL